MSKPQKGDPQKDEDVIGYVSGGTKLFTSSALKNYDQKTLRDVRCALEHWLADINKYLDFRNEQGRGGKR